MNSDQVKGAAKEVAGKIQKNVGDLTNNHSQQAEGLAREVAGKIQKGYGDLKENVKDAANDAEKASKQ